MPLVWLSVFWLVLTGALAASAESPEARERLRVAHELSNDLMSPFCPGRTLSDCPSPDAAQLRDEIRGWLDAGETPEQVRARVEGVYGDQVVGVPRTGWGWALPAALVVVVGIGFGVGLRRILSRPAPAPQALDPQLEKELLEELDDPR